MKKLSQLIYGTEDFKLEFDAPIDLAIERLNANVVRPSFSLLKLKSEEMVGKVSQNNVEIYRVIPFVKNSFKPVLMGSFSTEGNKTILSGSLGLHVFVQVFMTIWLGLIGLIFLIATIEAILTSFTEEWSFPFLGLLMFCFGLGLIKLGKSFSKNDKQWLKEQVSLAINRES